MSLNWGIIGAGLIARAFAVGAAASRTGKLTAIASRDLEKARKFAAEFNVPKPYGSYDALLQDRDIQAVYICTPHPMHAQWAIAALTAGKHVLCEKPFAMNHAEAKRVFEVARARSLCVVEAFMYRCHPQTARLVELLQQKVIGQVRLIQATFSFHATFDAQSRIFAKDLGGGGILDVGCYTTSMSRLIAGVAQGEKFADPIEIKGAGHLGATGVDAWAAALLKFPGDILAQLTTGVELTQDNDVKVFGSNGRLIIPNPWVPNRTAADQGKIIVQAKGKPVQEIHIPADRTSFSYEIDAFSQAVEDADRQPPHPAMSEADTLGNMKTLDAWRAQVGCIYDQDEPKNAPSC